MKPRWALPILMASCALPGASEPHQDAFREVEALWRRDATLPDPGNCLATARVLFADRNDFRIRCRAGGASDVANECLSEYARGAMGQKNGWLILIVEGSPTAERDIKHSALHALVACHLGRDDIYDGNHTDQRVWKLVP